MRPLILALACVTLALACTQNLVGTTTTTSAPIDTTRRSPAKSSTLPFDLPNDLVLVRDAGR